MFKSFGHSVLKCLHLDFNDQAREEVARRNSEAGRKVTERFSRGSVGLQAGKYITQNDLDKGKAELRRKLGC